MKKLQTSYICLILIFSFCIIISQYAIIDKNIDNSALVSSQVNDENKIIYLTFDDGPSENTIKILDILDKYEISATFFVVGPSYKAKNDLLKEIINRGHTLAIHSYNHIYSQIYSDQEEFFQDFNLCLKWIKSMTNVEPLLYRFPGGSSNTIANKDLIMQIIITLENQGYKHVDWNVDSLDSKYNNDSSIIKNNVANGIKLNEENKIYTQTILMHDNTKKVGTIYSLPTIIEFCLSKGYQFKTLTIDSPLIQHVKKPKQGL